MGTLGVGDGMRLMVADDDPVIRRLFQTIISGELPGATVDTCSDGSSAVGGFMQNRHNVLVMDLHMPVMDGIRAFDEIEKFCCADGVEIPSVIFCTAFAAGSRVKEIVNGDRRHCLLRKPVTANQLMAAIRMRLVRMAGD